MCFRNCLNLVFINTPVLKKITKILYSLYSHNLKDCVSLKENNTFTVFQNYVTKNCQIRIYSPFMLISHLAEVTGPAYVQCFVPSLVETDQVVQERILYHYIITISPSEIGCIRLFQKIYINPPFQIMLFAKYG